MEKHVYDEKTGISYTLQIDYDWRDLALPDGVGQLIGL